YRRRAATQCQQSWWGPQDDDVAMANAVMAGQIVLGNYGTFVIRPNPSWRSQPSLDYSGNGHQHSLYWALPLLRVGVATGNRAMISRFYGLMLDWIKDNPVRKPRQAAAYGQIETGFRLLTFSCALTSPIPSRKIRSKLLASFSTQATYAAKHWYPVNNASFHDAAGIYAAGCTLGSTKLKNAGLRYLRRISGRMIASDGSVDEASIWYARNTFIWTQQEIARVRACGSNPGTELTNSTRIPAFLAYGIRPDGRYEALGDGNVNRASTADAAGYPGFLYSASLGEQGSPQGPLFASFQKGFIFGRSGWGQSRVFKKETYYSVRTGVGAPTVFHAHADQGSLTMSSQGNELILDTGPYRTVSDSLAGYVRTRSAHNIVTIPGVKSTTPAPIVTSASSTPDGDLISMIDTSYGNAGTIVRTVFYDRIGDYFVVLDDVTTDRPRVFFQNWNLGPDRTVTSETSADLLSSRTDTDGTGPDVSIINLGAGSYQQVLAGSTAPYAGWNSANYGLITPSPSLQVTSSGTSARFVTVIAPRPSGALANTVSATGQLTADGASISTHIGGQDYPIVISRAGYARQP
ncbi:MAG: heparinase II/III family protein, partial [Actinomycetes bacterium]